MKEWLSAQELADERLRHLPQTKRGINMLVQREAWDSHPAFARRRRGEGGGMEYSYRILPTLAQIEYFQRHQLVGDEPTDTAEPVTPANGGTGRALRERDARLAIVASFERFEKGSKLRHMSCLQIFSDKYNLGTLAIDAWVRELIPRVSKRSIDRWREAQRDGKALGYDPGQSRRGTGVLDQADDGAVRTLMLALLTHQPHLTATHIRDQVEARFKTLSIRGRSVPVPPVRAFQRAIAELKASHHVELTKATNPDLYRSTMAPAGVGTLRYITEPNVLWMIDASPVDVLCTDGRFSMYGCIDIATRRFTITVSRTPRASAVALMLRKAIMTWGVPQTIKTDNGSDFVARDTQRLLASLGIEVDVSDAYSPQQKGHIERAIRTFQHDVGPQLPGFIGHSVADRKAIESRKSFAARLGESEHETFGVSISSVELQDYVDQWLELIYSRRPHDGLKGQTPYLKAAESKAPIRRVDERALDLLLMPVAGKDGQRITTKFGVRIDGHHYQTPSILPGTAVLVRMDPMDAGRALCFAADGAEFLGEAICAELRGIDPADLQRAARERHATIIAGKMAEAKRVERELGKRPLIEAALRLAAERVPNVVVLPKREETHSTPQIEAAIAAMSPQAPAPLSEAVSAVHAEILTELTAADTNVMPLRSAPTPAQLYRKARDLQARVAAGETIDQADAIWLGGYRESAAYQTQREMHEDFGDQALS